jgi:hypothetical protein
MDRADFSQRVSKSLINRRQVSPQTLMMRCRIKEVDVLFDPLCERVHEVVVLHRKADHLKQTCSARLYEKKVVNISAKEWWQIYPGAPNIRESITCLASSCVSTIAKGAVSPMMCEPGNGTVFSR